MANLSWSSLLRRRRNSEGGATAIEFAIVFPVLLLLFGTIFETGTFMFVQSQLQFATDNAARQIRTLKVGPGRAIQDATAFKTVVCNKFTVRSCTNSIAVDIQNGTKFGTLAGVFPDPLTIGKPPTGGNPTGAFSPGGPGSMGSLIVTYDWQFTFPGTSLLFGNVPGIPGIRRIAAVAVFQNEDEL